MFEGSELILAGLGIVAFLVTFTLALLGRYKKVGPNEALIISGMVRNRRIDPSKTLGFKVQVGGGAFVWPAIQKADVLSLEVMTIHVHTPEVVTDQGIPIQVDGIAQIKVDSDEVAIATAAEQFLGRGTKEIMDVALQTVEGHLRAILGTMRVEDIYKNREAFAQKVHEVATPDLAHMGLRIVSFTLRDITDGNGYLEALGKPRLAEVKRDALMKEAQATSQAQIAQAEANRDAAIRSAAAKKEGDVARFVAETEVAAANRDYQSKQAEYQATVQQKKAEADLAYDLSRFKKAQEVKKEEVSVDVIEKEQRILVQEKEILRAQKELEATVQKPADARRYAAQVDAEATRYRLSAEAEGQASATRSTGQARADVIKATGLAEAESIRAKGAAEAEVVRLRGLAEAEAMRKKAEAFQGYNAAAVVQMFTGMLPDLARAVSEPLAKMDKMVVINTGGEGGGASKVTADVAKIVAQLPPVIEGLSGVSLAEVVKQIPGLGPAFEAASRKPEAPAEANVVVGSPAVGGPEAR
jgi:flotillin